MLSSAYSNLNRLCGVRYEECDAETLAPSFNSGGELIVGSGLGVIAMRAFGKGFDVGDERLEVFVVVFYFVAKLVFDRLRKGKNEIDSSPK